MSVQVHDHDIERCLLVVLLILNVFLIDVLIVNCFLKYCILTRAFRIAILENMFKELSHLF